MAVKMQLIRLKQLIIIIFEVYGAIPIITYFLKKKCVFFSKAYSIKGDTKSNAGLIPLESGDIGEGLYAGLGRCIVVAPAAFHWPGFDFFPGKIEMAGNTGSMKKIKGLEVTQALDLERN